MARILKRPMFSRGGSTNENNGIMTGLVDRTEKNQGGRIGYAEGPTQAEIYADEYYNQLSKIQPSKPKFNIGEVGLNLMSGKYAGDGLIASLAGSATEPYTKYSTAYDKRSDLDYNTKMAAAKMGISKADAEAIAKAKAKATAAGTSPTTKVVKNISNQTLFNIPPGKTGYATNAQIIAVQGAFTEPEKRMITLPDGKVMPYEEYKIQNTNEVKSKALGTEYNILNALVSRMQTTLPETKTGPLGYGFKVVEGFSDQIAQLAESFGVKENWKEDDYDQGAIDEYLAKKGFVDSLEEGAAGAAIMKGAVINLAYALAKIAEPGNPKLSEGDIIRQLDRINYGSSRNTFAKGLTELLEQEKIRATETIEGFNLKASDYLKITGDKKDEKDEKDEKNKKDDGDPLGILS